MVNAMIDTHCHIDEEAFLEDREEAIARCRRALSEFIIEGVSTTIPFEQFLLESREFIEGRYDTGYIERVIKSGQFTKVKSQEPQG